MIGQTRLIGWLCAALMLAACGRSAISAPVPNAAASPTTTPKPIDTRTPTATPAPTSTATAVLPTSTPTELPTATPTALPVDPRRGQHPYTITLELTNSKSLTQPVSIGFLLYLPQTYGQDPNQQWPLILFLHGSGENGSDPALVAATGLPELLIGDADYPFIVVSPQAADGAVWWGTELDVVYALLDHIQANYAVDAKRVYLTGLSMGGFGAWAMIIRYPQRFAAVVPIAGGWNSENDSIPRNICAIKDVPIWAFHGEQDDIVLPKKSQLMVDALQKCGSNVQFTLYPEADHRASWAIAYADPALFEWLLAQQLPQ